VDLLPNHLDPIQKVFNRSPFILRGFYFPEELRNPVPGGSNDINDILVQFQFFLADTVDQAGNMKGEFGNPPESSVQGVVSD
jgi:hypothetical protein